ncbi:hypothetical protein GCK72_019401 [Caenorhabditis remanei]|uniref:Zinc finger CCCH domain-containing protein 14 n=1 Tax=Caenorhabditis remanei TaxID=31234 RepID=A0A6A5GDN7_CAERE|nr:hypothetical protein GCK72_019401 [Caenorhabditis remanei]KAF1752846.1 hypothetical protein GCK72_019401 [Caenorhabditis remanei]
MSSQTGTGTSEVSKKLKAAIRAKLEELGVYVDDELPDYIMVMIANKKEKVQMKDDLNLFIGKSTGKFVDWLFDLFDRLQNASSKQGETSKKDEEKEKQKEQEAKEQEEKRRKEKEEREREQQKEKEREREKERQRERDREKRLEEEKRREEKRKESQRTKRHRTRSRSNTYSDDERVPGNDRHTRNRRARSGERKKISAIDGRRESASPEKKLQSQVTVKRNIRPTGDTNVKRRGTMFLRAMNEASVSAGYGSSRKESRDDAHDEDDMSDVEALPSKSSKPSSSPKKSIRERLSRVNKGVIEPIDDDAVVLGNQPQSGGPQMILKLSGGKEAIKKTRIQDRIVVVDDSMRRGLLKRRIETPGVSEEPKSKHERIKFDVAQSRDSTPTDDSPTMQKWNGQIRLGEDSESEDEEAEIDAFVAEARGIVRKDSFMEEDDVPPTHQLSGAAYPIHITDGYPSTIPSYIPTPLSVLNEQQNQMGGTRDHTKERCVFWPKCTKGESCQFMHPSTPCKNFPNCTFGTRCLFIHPPCRFDRFCTKKHCPFTHQGTGGYQPGSGSAPEFKNPLTSNRIPPTTTVVAPSEEPPKPLVRGTLGSLAEKLAASIKKKPATAILTEKKEEKSDENETATTSNEVSPKEKEGSLSPPTSAPTRSLPEFAPLQNMIPCRYAGGCRNPVCHFKHPKECRFGATCHNPSCYYYHKPTNASSAPIVNPTPVADSSAAKYKWTATAN